MCCIDAFSVGAEAFVGVSLAAAGSPMSAVMTARLDARVIFPHHDLALCVTTPSPPGTQQPVGATASPFVPLTAKLSQQKYWRTVIYVGTSDEQELHPADGFTGIPHIPSLIAVRH